MAWGFNIFGGTGLTREEESIFSQYKDRCSSVTNDAATVVALSRLAIAIPTPTPPKEDATGLAAEADRVIISVDVQHKETSGTLTQLQLARSADRLGSLISTIADLSEGSTVQLRAKRIVVFTPTTDTPRKPKIEIETTTAKLTFGQSEIKLDKPTTAEATPAELEHLGFHVEDLHEDSSATPEGFRRVEAAIAEAVEEFIELETPEGLEARVLDSTSRSITPVESAGATVDTTPTRRRSSTLIDSRGAPQETPATRERSSAVDKRPDILDSVQRAGEIAKSKIGRVDFNEDSYTPYLFQIVIILITLTSLGLIALRISSLASGSVSGSEGECPADNLDGAQQPDQTDPSAQEDAFMGAQPGE